MGPRPAAAIFYVLRVGMEGAGRPGMEMDKGDGWTMPEQSRRFATRTWTRELFRIWDRGVTARSSGHVRYTSMTFSTDRAQRVRRRPRPTPGPRRTSVAQLAPYRRPLLARATLSGYPDEDASRNSDGGSASRPILG